MPYTSGSSLISSLLLVYVPQLIESQDRIFMAVEIRLVCREVFSRACYLNYFDDKNSYDMGYLQTNFIGML